MCEEWVLIYDSFVPKKEKSAQNRGADKAKTAELPIQEGANPVVLKCRRQTFHYAGVAVLDVYRGEFACGDELWSGVCQNLNQNFLAWERELVDKAMPTLADAYENDPHPRKKFTFRRLMLRLTFTHIEVTDTYFSCVLCVATEREGNTLTSRTLPMVYAPNGKAIPLCAFCSPAERKALSKAHHISWRKLRFAPFYMKDGKVVVSNNTTMK